MDSIVRILEAITKMKVYEEWRFHPVRKWRFDIAIPEIKLAAEWEGGIWIKGRHTRGQGYINDMEKYNAAAMAGWTVLRYAPYQTDKMLSDVEIYVSNLKSGRGK